MLLLVWGLSFFYNIGYNDLLKFYVVVDVLFESDFGVCYDFIV